MWRARVGRDRGCRILLYTYGYITLKTHKHSREKSSFFTHQLCFRPSPVSTSDYPQTQPITMSPQRETDAFPIQVLTSVNYPDWLAKKPRRGPTARKGAGKPPRRPIHNRSWVDKDHRIPQKPQVPAHAITKPKSERQQSVDARKPVQYYTWWLDCDKEFLLWGRLRKTFIFTMRSITYKPPLDYLVRIYVSGCETKHPGEWNPAVGPGTETDIGYMAQPPPNLNPTSMPYVYAWQPPSAPLFDGRFLNPQYIRRKR